MTMDYSNFTIPARVIAANEIQQHIQNDAQHAEMGLF